MHPRTRCVPGTIELANISRVKNANGLLTFAIIGSGLWIKFLLKNKLAHESALNAASDTIETSLKRRDSFKAVEMRSTNTLEHHDARSIWEQAREPPREPNEDVRAKYTQSYFIFKLFPQIPRKNITRDSVKESTSTHLREERTFWKNKPFTPISVHRYALYSSRTSNYIICTSLSRNGTTMPPHFSFIIRVIYSIVAYHILGFRNIPGKILVVMKCWKCRLVDGLI